MSITKCLLVFATVVALIEAATIGAAKSAEVTAEPNLAQQSLPLVEANKLFNKLETSKAQNQDKGADFTIQQLPQERDREEFTPKDN